MYFPVGWLNQHVAFKKQTSSFSQIGSLTKSVENSRIGSNDGIKLETYEYIKNIGKQCVWKMNSIDIPFLAVQIENRVVIYKINITETTQEKVKYAANDSTVVRKYSLQVFASARCDYGKITCISADFSSILVGTNLGYILAILWNGEVLQAISPDFMNTAQLFPVLTPPTPFSPIGNFKTNKPILISEDLGVRQIEYRKGLNFIAVVLNSGALFLLKNEKQTSNQFMEFKIMYSQQLCATCVSINPKHNVVAIGGLEFAFGDVMLYTITADGKSFLPSRRLSLKERNFEKYEIGAVSCISFTHDGNAIAVGYSKKGFSLFDTSGVCIQTTIPRSKNTNNASEDVLKQGASVLCWDTEGYKLFICGPNEPTFSVLSMVKSIVSRNPSQNNNSRIVFQGSDRLLLFFMTTASEMMNGDWEQLQYPRTYLETNYPIKIVALSPDSNYIAAAGKNGLVVYNRIVKNWRLFGDQIQEKKIICYGLHWIDDMVICVVNHNSQTNNFELIFYPRFHLDESSLVTKVEISKHKIIHVSSTSTVEYVNIYVYDSSRTIHVFKYIPNYKQEIVKAELYKMRTISLAKHLIFPLSMTCLSNSFEAGNHRLFFKHFDDSLTFVDVGEKVSNEMLLCKYVYDVWIENDTKERTIFFTYAKDGITMHIQNLQTKHKNLYSISELIYYDSDLRPLGPSTDAGVFVHGSGYTTGSKTVTNSPYHELKLKMFMYHHGVFLCMLLDEDYEEADFHRYAAKISSCQTFVACMEWLLHSVLDSTVSIKIAKVKPTGYEHPKVNDEKNLERIVRFLKQFPFFNGIVVSCLRKTDASNWPKLFNYAGQPKDIFHQLVDSNSFLDSLNMLRVLQQTDGLEIALECSYKIVPYLLRENMFEAVQDLARFIQILEIEKSGEDNADTQQQNVQLEGWMFNNYKLQEPILEKCHELLQNLDLKVLNQLIKTSNLPLSSWLSKKENFLFEEVKDWEVLFAKIHQSFSLPRADEEVNYLKSNMFLSPSTYEIISSHPNFTLFTPTQTYIYCFSSVRKELEFLLSSFTQANQVTISLLLSLLLCNMVSLEELTLADSNKADLLQKLLEHPNNVGYSKLKAAILDFKTVMSTHITEQSEQK